MALSNWDTLIFDHNGHSLPGSYTFQPTGIGVEVYKNWLNVFMKGNKGFTHAFHNGYAAYRGMNLLAESGPNNGIYFVATYTNYDLEKDDPMYFQGVAGCGIYGYDYSMDSFENENYEISVTYANGYEDSWFGSSGYGEEGTLIPQSAEEMHRTVEVMKDIKPSGAEGSAIKSYNVHYLGDSYFKGVSDENVNFLKAMIMREYSQEFTNVDWDSLQRFNQGDKFFADQLNEDLPHTQITKANKPVFKHLLESNNNDNS